MNKKNRRYLVTGSTGFVGASIVRRLVCKKEDVNIIVRNKKLNWRLKDISSNLNIYECDLLSKNLDKVIDEIKPTHIFHLAAYGSLPKESEIKNLIDVNLKGTINLVNAIKKNPFEIFVNTGSSSEYGNKEKAMKESDIAEPVNDYGITKLAATLFCQKESIRYSLPIVTFRLFSVYGPYEAKTRLIPSVIYSALKNEPIEVGNSKHVRDFIYIDDVVDAYLRSSNIKIKQGDIFNLGTGKQYSVEDVVNYVLNLSKSKSKVFWGKIKKQKRQDEPIKWQANISKLESVLRWKPEHDLKSGLDELTRWFRKHIYLYD
jgi:nucleoside-diphosphate-sugar epimerase